MDNTKREDAGKEPNPQTPNGEVLDYQGLGNPHPEQHQDVNNGEGIHGPVGFQVPQDYKLYEDLLKRVQRVEEAHQRNTVKAIGSTVDVPFGRAPFLLAVAANNERIQKLQQLHLDKIAEEIAKLENTILQEYPSAKGQLEVFKKEHDHQIAMLKKTADHSGGDGDQME